MDKKDLATLSPQELLEKLETSVNGLKEEEAKKRLAKYGENILKKRGTNPFRIFIKQFASSLIYLLLVAATLSFFLKDYSDGLVITTILLINAFLGFFQEYRSEKAMEKLERLINRQVLVKRDNKTVLLEEKLIVPGDIIIIKEGDIAPADLMLWSTDSLSVDESSLSGESVPLTKSKSSLVFAGSIVERGEGVGIVYAAGYQTKLGQIALLSESARKMTQYEKSLQQFSNYLMRISLIVLGFLFAAKLFLSQDFSSISNLALFIIALTVAVIPEALPVIATVTLAKGALRLSGRHVVVKRLSALEDLGNINLLCTDKTGTLTENKMSISGVVAEDRVFFLELAIASLETVDEKRKKSRDPYEQAFASYVPSEIKEQAKKYQQLEDLSFDPWARRRRVVIKNTAQEKYYLVVIGSAETLLEISASAKKNRYLDEIRNDGRKGIRDLGLAYKKIVYSENLNILEHEKGLNFLGFAQLVDPLRPTAKNTITLAEKLGIGIKVLTGDSREVTEYVGCEIGLLKEKDQVPTGEELEKMSPEQFKTAVNDCPMFARVTPEQKYNIVKVLKERYVVGYQGDGINDAPALKLADVGIAVDGATDVAKEAGEILLLRKDLEVIINGIHYGRAIFVNINKYIKYTMVGNFGNFFALAILYLFSLDLPLLPVQLLLASLITDLPHIFIYSDNVNNLQVKKPTVFNIRSLMLISLVLGGLTTVFELLFFAAVRFSVPFLSQTSLFLFLTFIQLMVIFSVRNTDYFWQGKGPSALLTITTFVVFLLLLTLIYVPLFARMFSFVFLPIENLLLIILLAFIYFLILDGVKVHSLKRVNDF